MGKRRQAELFGPSPSFTCRDCGRTSYNLNDVKQRYCGHCHKFMAELRGAVDIRDAQRRFAESYRKLLPKDDRRG
jgi:ribosomal protein L37E